MPQDNRQKVRDHISSCLKAKGDTASFTDADALKASGRLDSLDIVNTVVFLEDNFGLDFSNSDLDLGVLDSVDMIIQEIKKPR